MHANKDTENWGHPDEISNNQNLHESFKQSFHLLEPKAVNKNTVQHTKIQKLKNTQIKQSNNKAFKV